MIRTIINILEKECVVIDSEDILYYPEQYPFTKKQFNTFFYYIENKFKLYKKDVTDYFPEYIISFQYNYTKFIWRKLIGQGSAYQFHLFYRKINGNSIKYNEENIKFDEKNKVVLDDDMIQEIENEFIIKELIE